MTDWRSMESAPRDGTRILVRFVSVLDESIVSIAAYDKRSRLWADPLAVWDPITAPLTGWMPLPEAS